MLTYYIPAFWILTDIKRCYPDMENNAPEADVKNWNANPVVVDTNLITSRGPGTAAAFSYTILQELGLQDKSAALQKGMLFI